MVYSTKEFMLFGEAECAPSWGGQEDGGPQIKFTELASIGEGIKNRTLPLINFPLRLGQCERSMSENKIKLHGKKYAEC